MFLSEQEYDRLMRIRQDLQACQTENERLRAEIERLRAGGTDAPEVHQAPDR